MDEQEERATRRANHNAVEGASTADQEMQTETTQQLLKDLIQQVPNYDWQNSRGMGQEEEEDYDRIHTPKLIEPITYKRRGVQHVKGGGKVDVSMLYSQFYMQFVQVTLEA